MHERAVRTARSVGGFCLQNLARPLGNTRKSPAKPNGLDEHTTCTYG